MESLVLLFILLLILLVISALITAFEAAIFNASRIKLNSFSKNSVIAKKLLELKNKPQKLISTIVIVNNFVNILFTAVITAIAIQIATNRNISQSVSVFTATLITTIIIVIFGETVPKNIGAYRPERVAMFLHYFFMVFWYILSPFVVALSHVTNGILRLLRIKPTSLKVFETPEEVMSMIELGEREGIIEKNEQKMIFSIFEFGDTIVSDIMTPRVDIVALPTSATMEEILNRITTSNHSRIPVYEDQIDNIVGILYVKDLFKIFLNKVDVSVNLKDIIRSAHFVPETKRVDELFNEMQKNKIQIALVFDEYGGLSGLVTIEDILEEIVGEIMDEYEKEEKLCEKIGENAYLISGALSIEEFNENFDADFSDEEASTIGGIVLEKLGRLPYPGEEINIGNFKFIISKIRDRRIVQVKVILKPREDSNEKETD